MVFGFILGDILFYPNFYAEVIFCLLTKKFKESVFPVLVDIPESVGLEEGERAGGKTQK
jgi:hypothetical protein